MSYFNPAARITANTQESFEYAIYVIFGSYFKKTICNSPIREAAMHINYKETKPDIQYRMEEYCDKEAEKLFRRLPAYVMSGSVNVSFIERNGFLPEIRFAGDSFMLRVSGFYRNGRSEIRTQFLEKVNNAFHPTEIEVSSAVRG